MESMLLKNWNGSLGQTPLNCVGSMGPILSLGFSGLTECSYFLISGSMDGVPMMRHGDTGDWVGTFGGHCGPVWSVALDKYALLAASSSSDLSAKLWNAVTGQLIHTLKHDGGVKSVDFDQTCTHLVTAGNEKLIRVHDLERPECEPQLFLGHTRSIRCALFCRENRCILSTGDDRFLRLWDLVSGLEIWSQHLPIVAKCLEVTDDRIVSVAFGPHVRFFDVKTMLMIKECKLPCKVNDVTLDPKLEYFICAGDNSMLYKYDYQYTVLVDSFKAHSGPVNIVKFSPDGELYASGSDDGLLRLWQTTPGKSYGLWKWEDASESSDVETN